MSFRALILLGLVGMVIAPASALEPADIVVVVNSRLRESVALGRFYCDKRKVPLKHLVELDLPTTDVISQADFNAKFRLPLKKAIADRGLNDQVQCILTVRGTPFRVDAGPPTPEITRMLAWYAAMMKAAEKRMARNCLLLEKVGSHFPASAKPTTEPEQFDALFEATVEIPADLPPVKVMRQRFSLLARQKAAQLGSIADQDKRAIAARQIISLYLDMFGLMGWSSAVETVGAYGPPVPGALKQERLEEELRRRKLINIKRPDASVLVEIGESFIVSTGVAGLHSAVIDLAKSTAGRTKDSIASVDSELALVLCKDYPRPSYLINPLQWQSALNRTKFETKLGGRAVMVSRLDGPTVESVMRMVLHSIEVEAQPEGLGGTFYVDLGARRPLQFDKDLMNLVQGFTYATEIPMVADGEPSVFASGACPDAGLYVGWQSSNHYVPAFTWRRGAIGVHVAMTEAQQLRDPASQQWAPRMIAEGVVATVAAADDPSVAAFPPPSAFFGLLATGTMPISEVYWRTTPMTSWRMMLIADPLYNPFKKNPQALELPEAMLRPIIRRSGAPR